MYVPKRSPAAHQVAASQSSFGGCHIYLESGTDCRFWRYFVDDTKVMLHACNGCEKVIDTVNLSVSKGVTCIGIIDNDFRTLTAYPNPVPSNVFTSDDHDIEMMVLKTDASRRVVTRFDATGKITAFENIDGDLMEFVYGITDSIGLLKLVNIKSDLDMVFKKPGKDQTFVLPNYENFLDDTCHYKSDEAMIRYLCAWSTDQRKRPNKNDQEIKDLIDAEKEANHDTFQLSCGHDASYILAYILRKRISNRRSITPEIIEDLLYVSFSPESLKGTDLYRRIKQWSNVNGIDVFNV